MSRRLFRVTATFPDGKVKVRHYQTKAAAEHRVSVFRDWREGPHGTLIAGVTVTIEASNLILWPAS
jgi:hypothetical protein